MNKYTNKELADVNPFSTLGDSAELNDKLMAKWNTMGEEEVHNINRFMKEFSQAKWDLAAKHNINSVDVLKHLP